METTTLVTFRMRHHTARTVDLVGSWDNFAKPYPMQRDSRRDHYEWTGCYTFDDIICDGDLTDFSVKRNGGLKMGGTYWYYYRIDGDEECFNDAEPTTTACPLLPGQTMNVLDVPEDAKTRGNHSRSSSVSFVFASQTLNPLDRFVNPTPIQQSLKPTLPRLITPSTLEQPGFDLDSFYAQRNRPWSAVTPKVDAKDVDFAKNQRNIKSASSSPTTTLKSAFDHMLHPVPPSALTPSQGGRGRSRVLHSIHDRTGRTIDPSVRELRDVAPIESPNESPVDALGSTTELVADATSMPNKRRSESPRRFKRGVVEQLHQPETVGALPDAKEFRVRGRSPSSAERRHSGSIYRRGRAHDDWPSRRSTSLGRPRKDPSPLRNMLLQSSEQRDLDLKIPDGIMEVENEDLISPRRPCPDRIEVKPRPQTSCPGLQPRAANIDRPISQPQPGVSPGSPRVEKELPPLPAYLIPEPLFSKEPSRVEVFDDALQTMSDVYIPGSHFTGWSTTSDNMDLDHPESPGTEHIENSPTFSSIKDIESGACSPNRLSGAGFDTDLHPASAQGIGLMCLDMECCSVDTGASTANADMEGRTPTAASFASEKRGKREPPAEILSSLQANERKQPEQPRRLTQMEQLLTDFDYLGAALV